MCIQYTYKIVSRMFGIPVLFPIYVKKNKNSHTLVERVKIIPNVNRNNNNK